MSVMTFFSSSGGIIYRFSLSSSSSLNGSNGSSELLDRGRHGGLSMIPWADNLPKESDLPFSSVDPFYAEFTVRPRRSAPLAYSVGLLIAIQLWTAVTDASGTTYRDKIFFLVSDDLHASSTCTSHIRD